MKALHPSDHEIKVTRVPGGTDNTVALAIDQTFTVAADAAQPDVKIVMTPNIMAPLVVYRGSGGNFTGSYAQFSPPVFGGQGYTVQMYYDTAKCHTMNIALRDFEAMRITSESMTVNFLAPATANQGTVTSAQVPSYPQTIHIIPTNATDITLGTDVTGILAAMPIDVYDQIPIKSKLLTGSRAYTGQARDGVYQPLRLSSFDWYNLAKTARRGRWIRNAATGTPMCPFAGQNLVDFDFYAPDTTVAMDVWTMGDMGNNMGVTYFEGVDATAAYEIRFRMTVEARVNPGSTYASLCEIPPLTDELAIKMYHEIASRMKNAYPASYNDWDELKNTIKKIGRAALTVADPLIHMVTAGLPLGGALSSIGTSITDGLRRKLQASDKAEDYQMDEEEAARIAAAESLKKAINKQVTQTAQKRARQRKLAKQTKTVRKKLSIQRPGASAKSKK